MNKAVGLILLSLFFVFCGLLIGCNTIDGVALSPNTVGIAVSFEDAVQECYELAAETLFYSTDGIKPTASNRIKGENEIAGVCTDYALEFAYYWNEVENYDILYGKAYLARIPAGGSTFDIFDFRFAKNGTSKIRERSGNFKINGNDKENDGVYRDAIIISTKYSGKPISHFNQNIKNHKWIVIKYNNDWYDCEPTWWDTNNNIDFVPYKINF
ncbi:MAG: hypothetical protein LBE13_14925 [Bacteroidales bacterium]|nr:hypothetical protein [Bacteroidales bacterium]